MKIILCKFFFCEEQIVSLKEIENRASKLCNLDVEGYQELF